MHNVATGIPGTKMLAESYMARKIVTADTEFMVLPFPRCTYKPNSHNQRFGLYA